MGIREDGLICGSVSGGCVETSVVAEALECLKTGAVKELFFDRITDEDAWAVGLACGGSIRVFVDPRPVDRDPELWTTVVATTRQNKPVFIEIDLATGDRQLVSAGLSAKDGTFMHRLDPPVRIVCFGAAHIAVALAKLAETVGYGITIIDPRAVFTRDERFANVTATLLTAWPDEANVSLDAQTFVVILSHDDKIDIPALALCLRSPVAYIGALGSRPTQAKRRTALLEQGFTAADLARIHGPIGLDIGASTPEEIAVSILSEIVAVRHGKR